MQRQSCDLVAAINAILDVQPAAEHVMMMEDDWLFCPHGLESLRYFLSKACAMRTTHIPCISHACIVHTPCMYKPRPLTTTPCNPLHPPPPLAPLHISSSHLPIGLPVRPWLAGTARLLRLQWRRGASGGRHYIGLQPPCIGLQPPKQNGVALCQADLPALQRHLLAHFERRPPDHLLFEWFSGERADTRALAAGRSYRIFRHNLFFHIGTKSTINQPSHRFIPGCYALPARETRPVPP